MVSNLLPLRLTYFLLFAEAVTCCSLFVIVNIVPFDFIQTFGNFCAVILEGIGNKLIGALV